jgi:hypothetical protein
VNDVDLHRPYSPLTRTPYGWTLGLGKIITSMLTALLKTVKATSADAPVAPLVVVLLRFPVTSCFRAETRPQFTRCRATDTLKPKCLKSLKISPVVRAELASQRYAAPVGQSHGATAASSLRQPQMARAGHDLLRSTPGAPSRRTPRTRDTAYQRAVHRGARRPPGRTALLV